MKKFIFGLFVVLLTACRTTGDMVTTDYPSATSATNPTRAIESPVPELQNPETGSPTPSEMPQPDPQTTTAVNMNDEGLWVKILEPADETVVNSPEITLHGEASPDTVVSINDELVYIEPGKDPAFTVKLLLEEGENLIEIYASNSNEEEVYMVWTLYYEPPE